jgi:hypothetical protein
VRLAHTALLGFRTASLHRTFDAEFLDWFLTTRNIPKLGIATIPSHQRGEAIVGAGVIYPNDPDTGVRRGPRG